MIILETWRINMKTITIEAKDIYEVGDFIWIKETNQLAIVTKGMDTKDTEVFCCYYWAYIDEISKSSHTFRIKISEIQPIKDYQEAYELLDKNRCDVLDKAKELDYGLWGLIDALKCMNKKNALLINDYLKEKLLTK
jgi:hypothetical protein